MTELFCWYCGAVHCRQHEGTLHYADGCIHMHFGEYHAKLVLARVRDLTQPHEQGWACLTKESRTVLWSPGGKALCKLIYYAGYGTQQVVVAMHKADPNRAFTLYWQAKRQKCKWLHFDKPDQTTSWSIAVSEAGRLLAPALRLLIGHAAAAQGVELPRDVVGEILGWL